MQGMVSGLLLVAAFAAAAGASALVAVRLYRLSGAAARSDAARDGTGRGRRASKVQDRPDA